MGANLFISQLKQSLFNKLFFVFFKKLFSMSVEILDLDSKF